jgi:hypothetical protein
MIMITRYQLDGKVFDAHRDRGRTSPSKSKTEMNTRPYGSSRVRPQIDEDSAGKATTFIERISSNLRVVESKLSNLGIATLSDSFSSNDSGIVF